MIAVLLEEAFFRVPLFQTFALLFPLLYFRPHTPSKDVSRITAPA